MAGTVRDMNLMYTTLQERQTQGAFPTLLRVPNSQFFLKPQRCRMRRDDPHRASFLDAATVSQIQSDSRTRERSGRRGTQDDRASD